MTHPSCPFGILSLALQGAAERSAFALARQQALSDRLRKQQQSQLAEQIERMCAALDQNDTANENPARPDSALMEWFAAASLSLSTIASPSALRTHSGATARWHVTDCIRLSLWRPSQRRL